MTTYHLTIERHPDYLHARVTGPNTPQNVAGYFKELSERAAALGCPDVLVEELLEGPRLGTFDVHKIVAEGSRRAMLNIRFLAYVDASLAANIEMMRFAETVAVNRGVRARVFASVPEARDWLLERVRFMREAEAAEARTPPESDPRR